MEATISSAETDAAEIVEAVGPSAQAPWRQTTSTNCELIRIMDNQIAAAVASGDITKLASVLRG